MQDFDPIDVNFLINSAEVKAATEQVKTDLKSVGQTAEETTAKVNAQLNTAFGKSKKPTGINTSNTQLAEQDKLLKSISDKYRSLLSESLVTFGGLNAAQKTLIFQYHDNIAAIDQVKLAQVELNNSFENGKINVMDYTKAQAALSVQEAKIQGDLKGVKDALISSNQALGTQAGLINKARPQWNGLGNSINQITRELPAFALSAQTGFLAISNNIPILADEIGRLQTKNNELTASGQKSIPIWSQVAKGLLSWGTVLSAGVVLLTVYGKQMVDWVSNLIKGDKAIKKLTESEKEALEGKQKMVKSIKEEYVNLNILIGSITKSNISQKERSKLISELNTKYPFFLSHLQKEKVTNNELISKLEEVNRLYVVRIALQSQQKDIEAQFEKVAKKDLQLSTDQLLVEERLAGIQKKINKDRQTLGRGAQIDLENKSYEEQIKIIKKALITERDFYSKESTKEGPNQEAFKQRLASRNKELALVLEAEKINNRTRFGLEDENKILKEKQELLGKLESKYKTTLEDINNIFNIGKNKQGTGTEAIVNAYQNLLDKLSAIDKEYARKSFTKDEEEMQALRDKFSEVRKLVQRFNADPKNKAQIIDLSNLNKLEVQATDTLGYRQSTEKLKIELDVQKKLYEEFETFKKQFGQEEAENEFAGRIEKATTYYDYLKKKQQENNQAYEAVDKGTATGGEIERTQLLNESLKKETDEQKKLFNDQLASLLNYQKKRKLLIKKYHEERLKLTAAGKTDEVTELDAQHKEELDSLDDANIKKLQSYKELFNGIVGITAKEAKIVIANAKKLIDTLEMSAEMKAAILKKIAETEKLLSSESLDNVYKYGTAIASLGGAFADLGDSLDNSGLSNAGALLSGLGKSLGDVLTVFDKNSSKADVITAGINGAITLVGVFASAAAKRKAAEEEYYLSVIGFQNQYNLSLQEQIRLRSILDENVFIKDYEGRITDALASLGSANDEYQKALDNLTNKGKAKIGQRNAVDWGNVGSAASSGAAMGAAIGSVVPVIGTAIGAIVGGIAGAIGGLFGTKKKDKYGSILKEYPELIEKSENGMLRINKALAESLVANNLVNKETKQILENILAWEKALEEARAQIKEVISELTGNLSADLKTLLVDAFVSGENAALKMGDTVEKVLENILSSLIFNSIFSDAFDSLEKQMTASFDIGGDANWVDDFANFFNSASGLTDDFNAAMAAAQAEAANFGFDVFNKDKISTRQGLTGAIRRELTEETGSELTGLFRGQYDITKRLYQITEEYYERERQHYGSILSLIAINTKIEVNTANTVHQLELSLQELKSIAENTKKHYLLDLG